MLALLPKELAVAHTIIQRFHANNTVTCYISPFFFHPEFLRLWLKITSWNVQLQEVFFIYLSNMAYTSEEGWWIVQIMVVPWAANRWSAATILWAMNESRPEVGSSANSNGGSVMTCWIMTRQCQYTYIVVMQWFLLVSNMNIYGSCVKQDNASKRSTYFQYNGSVM